jgi:hypothetical protein
MSRPYAGEEKEPIKRRAILSQQKLITEGSPAKKQVVMGWLRNTQKHTISLPNGKYEAWVSSLEAIVADQTHTKGELETLKEQLNHTAHMIAMTRHFITRT